jgi:GxxExxY protein
MNTKNTSQINYPLPEILEKVIKCAQAVHKHVGNGFHELVYKRPLEYEFFFQNVPFGQETEHFNNVGISQSDRTGNEFIVDQKIAIELKSTLRIEDFHLERTLEYLKANGLEYGLIINFGRESFEYRIVISEEVRKENRLLEEEWILHSGVRVI